MPGTASIDYVFVPYSHVEKQVPQDVTGTARASALRKKAEDLIEEVRKGVGEKNAEGKTPDLLITKGDETYVVEVRTVRGRADEERLQRKRVQRALAGITTRTPIHINAMAVSATASTKRFRQHVLNTLADGKPGPRRSESDGMYVQYEVSEPSDDAEEFPAVFGWPVTTIYGNDSDRIAKAIHDKLRTYRFPIIVALDLIDVLYGFEDVEKAFHGERPIVQPLAGRGAAREAYLGPAQGGLLVGRSRDSERARERLTALLPFAIGYNPDTGEATVSARLLAVFSSRLNAAPTSFHPGRSSEPPRNRRANN